MIRCKRSNRVISPTKERGRGGEVGMIGIIYVKNEKASTF